MFAQQHRQQFKQFLLHIAAVDNPVNRTFFQQEFRTLETRWQFFPDCLFDDPWSGKPDKRLRFCQHDIAHKGE